MEKKALMIEALKEAKIGAEKKHGGPFGAVVAKQGKIIGRAHNEVLKNNDPTAHAEILTVRKAAKKLKRFNLSDCEIFSNCEPCPMCYSAIAWAGIKKSYFGCTAKDAALLGFRDKKIFEAIEKKQKNKVVEEMQLLRRECLEIFEIWRKQKHKRLY